MLTGETSRACCGVHETIWSVGSSIVTPGGPTGDFFFFFFDSWM